MNSYTNVLFQYIIETMLISLVFCGFVIIYRIIKKKKKSFSKIENIISAIIIVVLFFYGIGMSSLAISDIMNIDNSIISIDAESAYYESSNTTYSNHDRIIGRPITVKDKNGGLYSLYSVDHFPYKVDNAIIKYAEKSRIIVDFETN